MVTLIMMMVMLAKWQECRGAECSVSALAHLICPPVPASEWERKLVNSRTEDCSFLFSCFFSTPFSFRDLRADTMCCGLHWGLCGSQAIHLYTLLLVGDMKVPSLAALIDSYFSQGIKSYCKKHPLLPFKH